MKYLRLHRQAHVLHRQVLWLYEDAPSPTTLKLLRQVARLRRRVMWINKPPLRPMIEILRKIYLPAIERLFQEQTMLAELLK